MIVVEVMGSKKKGFGHISEFKIKRNNISDPYKHGDVCFCFFQTNFWRKKTPIYISMYLLSIILLFR